MFRKGSTTESHLIVLVHHGGPSVDLLTVPMQRILKYHKLLQRLLGQTRASHEEYHSIEQAYNCIINVSEVSL